jgi:LemA protein
MKMALGVLMIVGLIALFFVVAVIGYVIIVYNSLVRLKNDIEKAWSNIDVLLKQRFDELTKLIDAVKGYMRHEKDVFTEITKARTAFMNATTMSAKAKADNMISGALKSLFAVAENYPTLKANENFMQLQGRISGIENELADRREFYNDNVNTYNIKIQSFPDMIIAKMLNAQKKDLFKAAEEEKKDVKVQF